MSNSRWYAAAMVILVICLSSCGQSTDNVDLEGTNWILVDMAGEPPITGSGISIGFEDGQVHGRTGCNSFSGPYSLHGNELEFGVLMRTLMACMDDALMQQESRMDELLGQVEQVQLTDGQLHLVLSDGRQLIYEPSE